MHIHIYRYIYIFHRYILYVAFMYTLYILYITILCLFKAQYVHYEENNLKQKKMNKELVIFFIIACHNQTIERG